MVLVDPVDVNLNQFLVLLNEYKRFYDFNAQTKPMCLCVKMYDVVILDSHDYVYFENLKIFITYRRCIWKCPEPFGLFVRNGKAYKQSNGSKHGEQGPNAR